MTKQCILCGAGLAMAEEHYCATCRREQDGVIDLLEHDTAWKQEIEELARDEQRLTRNEQRRVNGLRRVIPMTTAHDRQATATAYATRDPQTIDEQIAASMKMEPGEDWSAEQTDRLDLLVRTLETGIQRGCLTAEMALVFWTDLQLNCVAEHLGRPQWPDSQKRSAYLERLKLAKGSGVPHPNHFETLRDISTGRYRKIRQIALEKIRDL